MITSRHVRALVVFAAFLLAPARGVSAQPGDGAPLAILDVPFVSQTEALCGGAAAAMVLRYWGERELTAQSFAHLVDRSAAGIRTEALVADLRRRGWTATGIAGRDAAVRAELERGRPVLALIQDRPAVHHYVVVVAWHDRGVVFHDPARAPFRVVTEAEFHRRWREAGHWMAVVAPGEQVGLRAPATGVPTRNADVNGVAAAPATLSRCDQLVSEGVARAQSHDLGSAERLLVMAFGCPGPAARRELAGVRLLQRRWDEVADLASAAIADDGGDAYTWKLLATARFVQDDRLGALDAWNRAGEPRLDLIRVDGLVRTRHPVIERMLAIKPGQVLTSGDFVRARRQLAELPSAMSARLEYVPVAGGLTELRAAVIERPLVATDRVSLLALGVAAAAGRELRLTIGSLTGGGEHMSAAVRVWPRRPRVAVGFRTPGPWGGLWGVDAAAERQPFTSGIPDAERARAQFRISDWMTARARLALAAGVEAWKAGGMFARFDADARLVSLHDRLEARVQLSGWSGGSRFGTVQIAARARSSGVTAAGAPGPAPGVIVSSSLGFQRTIGRAPLDQSFAGDTGHARGTLLRAHPVLDGGALRVDRLGGQLVHMSLEGQRWWQVTAALRAAAVGFVDVAHTSRRFTGPSQLDVDTGIGARFAIAGVPGAVRLDLGRGLRDGVSALSLLHQLGTGD